MKNAEWQNNYSNLISWQEKAVENFQKMLAYFYSNSFISLSKMTNLQQNINPWNISLLQVISETKGDSELEVEIASKVAGYGSQLGTIIDALKVLLPKGDQRRDLDESSLFAVLKLEHLASEIERIKDR